MQKIKKIIKRLKGKSFTSIIKVLFSLVFHRRLDKYAPIVYQMAITGEGTDSCLKLGCLPMAVHFYSPIPDIKDLVDRRLFDKKSSLAGIDFNQERQVSLLLELGKKYGDECDWPFERTDNEYQYYQNNGNFSYGCASSLYSVVRNFRPNKIIEVGSGNSSLVISSALGKNGTEDSLYDPEYSIIDPYPREIITSGKLQDLTKVLKEKVELTDVELFKKLDKNDILFIDSSHSVKFGSDVNFLILEVLPLLKPGVIIHFHDINIPYAPPEAYFTNPRFRVFWNEEFLLQSFLSCNDKFEVLLAMAFLQKEHMDIFCEAFPHFNKETNWANSGSFWIRAKANI